jgi:hypothetical protein
MRTCDSQKRKNESTVNSGNDDLHDEQEGSGYVQVLYTYLLSRSEI